MICRKLNDTFGKCGIPRVGWQIDPFGHSREMASIFSQLGFDGLLLGRIDYQDKDFRFRTKTAEVVWEGSHNLGENFVSNHKRYQYVIRLKTRLIMAAPISLTILGLVVFDMLNR